MMKLKPGEIFGLSDFLFDDSGEKESNDTSNGGNSKKLNFNDSDDEDNKWNDNEYAESENGRELNSQNLLNYYFIANTRQVPCFPFFALTYINYFKNFIFQLECYIIDKEYYIKNMQLFTEDKNIINKYLQTLVSYDIIFILIWMQN